MAVSVPIVTLILPVFNGSRTLTQAVESIRQQTFKDWELFILDDASTDDTFCIGSSFNDDRVAVISKRGESGLAARLNQGIDLARGKYIARMDADDIAFPERLDRQVEYLEEHTNVNLLGTGAIVFRDDGRIVGMLPFAHSHADICARPWNNFPLAHPTWMGRAEWFRTYRYRIPEFRRAEDQELLLRSYSESTFACLPEVLLAYRQGRFCAKKTLSGRTSLLRAQLQHFIRCGDVGSIFKSLTWFGLKSLVDLVASLPGADSLYFKRMNASPSPESAQHFKILYEMYCA
jgi:glycosyltransferase involved in cell wall biosynthesis